jgi:hypothetical protein
VRRLAAVGFALSFAAAPASAQRSEVALAVGFASAGDVEQKAAGIEELEAGGGFAWGVQAGRLVTPRLGLEVSWLRQQSAVALGTAGGRADLFEMSLSQLHGSVLYHFGSEEAAWRPFLRAGLGASFFGADELESETKLSFALGAGVKWFPSARWGARFDARYNPTYLNDSSSDFCDPFGFCQAWLQQFELTGGVVVRF